MTSQNEAGDLVLSEALQYLIHRWWLVAVFIIAGGLAGWLFSLVQRPVYESVAEITTVIDYAYSGRLTDTEADHLITAVGEVINSTEVTDKVKVELARTGFEIGDGELEDSLSLSRQGYRWELSSRFSDPKHAQRVNEIWLETGTQALTELKQDSLNGVQAYLVQQSIETCFSQAVVVEPVSAFCTAQELEELTQKVASSGSAEDKSLLDSLNLSGLSFQVTRLPDLPVTPVRRQSSLLVLSGAMIGLLASIMFFLPGLPKTGNLTDVSVGKTLE